MCPAWAASIRRMGLRSPRRRPPRRNPRLRRPSLSGDEPEGEAVVAVAQARGLGPVGEDVAVVAEALGAVILVARHADRQVHLLREGAGDGGVEARPAGAALELPLRL